MPQAISRSEFVKTLNIGLMCYTKRQMFDKCTLIEGGALADKHGKEEVEASKEQVMGMYKAVVTCFLQKSDAYA
ncbi:hypothetical protein P3L10_019695 [Capsicum annuum]